MVELIWSVRIQGGSSCSIKMPFGIYQTHDGNLSVWKVRATQKQVQGVLDVLEANGCKVVAYEESQTPEQKSDRQKMLDVQDEGFIFQTEKCPSCAMFDPLTDNNCGAEDWEPSFFATVRLKEKAASDWEACPIRNPVQRRG